jgi:hypothetical protein
VSTSYITWALTFFVFFVNAWVWTSYIIHILYIVSKFAFDSECGQLIYYIY